MWCFVSYLLSVFSGWNGAASIYRNESEEPEETFSFQSARINIVDYNGCLIFGRNERGLFIKAMLIFRLGNPTLFIPWEEVQVEDSSIAFIKRKTITFRRYGEMKVVISNRLAEKIIR